MLTTRKTSTRLGVLGLASIIAATSGGEALAKKKAPKDYSPLVFDASKRKKTKTRVSDRLTYFAYTSLRFQGERNINLDDGITDVSDEYAAYLGAAAKFQISESVLAFAHAELDLRTKNTHVKQYGLIKKLKVKEALVSFKLNDANTLTLGRMRFSDAHKWIADASVDGVHFAHKSNGRAYEAAIFRDVFNDAGDYALFHTTRFSKKARAGVYVLAENAKTERRVHVIGYLKSSPSARFSYTLHGAGVLGDASNGKSSGFGFDARATYKFDLPNKPQVTFGLAAGSDGFRQTGLHSNKSYDGGQTQFNRYGYVFQPELTNLAAATVSLGMRPSRNFSVDLAAHFYTQLSPSTTAPIARVRGTTNGTSAYLGSELSLVGAWRPSKKTKFEFGIGSFKPGSAYSNHTSSKRVYARLSMYF